MPPAQPTAGRSILFPRVLKSPLYRPPATTVFCAPKPDWLQTQKLFGYNNRARVRGEESLHKAQRHH